MFNADGELREEYSHLEGGPSESAVEPERATADDPGKPVESTRPAPEPDGASKGRSDAESAHDGAPRLELPRTPGSADAPTFMDLLAVLAEPISVYLGDVQLPDGKSLENLDAARVHIDLLSLLREKTAGNLAAQEAALLDNLLYEVQMRYVQKRG